MEFIIRTILAVCSAASLIIGIISVKKNKSPLFDKIVCCAIGCIMLGRLFDFVICLVDDNIPIGLNLGEIGAFGGFLFFFSASFGQMDGLVDDHQTKHKMYRIVPLVGPIILLGVFAIYFLVEKDLFHLVVRAFIFLVMGFASYFNLKHLIFPNDELNILKSIRKYNLAVLIMILLSALQFVFENLSSLIPWTIVSILLCFTYIVLLPILQGGTKKWAL